MKTRTRALAVMLAAFMPLAHASVASDARAFKEGVKSAGKQGGHAVRDAAIEVGHGAKAAGHAVADTTRRGWRATKKAVTGHE